MSNSWWASFAEEKRLKWDVDLQIRDLHITFARFANATLERDSQSFITKEETRNDLCRHLTELMAPFKAPVAMTSADIEDRVLQRDLYRAQKLMDWVQDIGRKTMLPGCQRHFRAFTETTALAAVKTASSAAPETNLALSMAYANLLAISAHPKLNTGESGRICALNDYTAQLNHVWRAASLYEGYQDIFKAELNDQLALVSGYWDELENVPGTREQTPHGYINSFLGSFSV